jgi:hypothetical protein
MTVTISIFNTGVAPPPPLVPSAPLSGGKVDASHTCEGCKGTGRGIDSSNGHPLYHNGRGQEKKLSHGASVRSSSSDILP